MGDICYDQNVPVSNQLSQAANIVHYCMKYNEKVKRGSVSRTHSFYDPLMLCIMYPRIR